MCGLSGIGLLSCLLMDEVPLRTDMDDTWGLRDVEKDDSATDGSVAENTSI
jgi:hypothetical protein